MTNDEFAGQPMIFAVFGRGRALPPFVGKGITRENLLECVYFLTGACSCTVKDQNPGMDLLFAENWWTVAEKLASLVGAEEGNETQLGAAQLFPHLMIPGGQAAADSPKEPAGEVESPRVESPKAESPKAESPKETKPPVETPAATSAEPKAAVESDMPKAAPEEPQDQAKAQAEKPPTEEPQDNVPPAKDRPKTEPASETKPPASQPVQTPASPAAGHPAHTDSAHGTDHPERRRPTRSESLRLVRGCAWPWCYCSA